MSDLEDDYNQSAHTALLQAISGLKKTLHIPQSTRNEPKIKQDEFELFKGPDISTEHENDRNAPIAVSVNDLVKVLHKQKSHLDAGKLLRNVYHTKKVFRKPLEKPSADRIKRQIGYEKVEAKLQRWDAVVAKNRSAETQVFPSAAEKVYIYSSLTKPLQHTIKSDLKREMNAVEENLCRLKREREGDLDDEKELEKQQNNLHKIKLTREELIAQRKELAYLRMRESQQSAKARLRNKIKSKKYHKLLRRQKLQEQLKEFEQLQKTNPEAALEKLNELEKNRVLERATLRHKNTGSWAKNLQVRAKYDKDVRKNLAEQLQLSRQLTQKSKLNDNEESDENSRSVECNQLTETEQQEKSEFCGDPLNSWITTERKSSAENETANQENDKNWRKYWMERNRNEELLRAYKTELNRAKEDKEDANIKDQKLNETYATNAGESTEKKSNGSGTDNSNLKEAQKLKTDGNTVEGKKIKISKKRTVPKCAKSAAHEANVKIHQLKKKPKYENGWLVEEIESNEVTTPPSDIDHLFDEFEDKIEMSVQKKLKHLNEKQKYMNKPRKMKTHLNKEVDELKHLNDLSFKEKIKHPTLDEELGEKTNTTKEIAAASSITKINQETKTKDFIDPCNFPTDTFKQPHFNTLKTAVDDEGVEDTEIVELGGPFQENQMTIGEAFEDDGIVADFGEEKTKDTELKNTEIQLSMPGWGSWGGAGIDESKKQKSNKRIVLKLASEEKRRDENKDSIYFNEETGKHLRPHLVSDLPFPFTSLQDYEASIRAPIGRNFVTETAFRRLIRPAVITRKGAIIEPMSEEELTKGPHRRHTVKDKQMKKN